MLNGIESREAEGTAAEEGNRIDLAIRRGVTFLETAQLPSGEIPIEAAATAEMSGERAPEPVVFCAALAARALAGTPEAARICARACDFLQREMRRGGLWRHPSTAKPDHVYAPLDVDDTALASAALRAAGRPVPNNRRALVREREPDGLFRTWIVRWWPHPFLTRHFFKYVAEPHDVDLVINANAVFYLGDCEETRPAIARMLAVLRAGGEMESTIWYGSTHTVWYFFSHALRAIAPEAGEIVLPRLRAAVPGNALDLATATATLALWGEIPDPEPLLAAQRSDGSWPNVGLYHMGRRRLEPQPRTPWFGSEALTTMFAVEALSRCRERLRGA